MEAKHKKVEQENEWLKQEMEELWAGFITQKGELEGEYKKIVDDMFSFGYWCCMKKHGITQDTPNYPSDDKNEAISSHVHEDGDVAKVGPFGGQACPFSFLYIFLSSS